MYSTHVVATEVQFYRVTATIAGLLALLLRYLYGLLSLFVDGTFCIVMPTHPTLCASVSVAGWTSSLVAENVRGWNSDPIARSSTDQWAGCCDLGLLLFREFFCKIGW